MLGWDAASLSDEGIQEDQGLMIGDLIAEWLQAGG